MDSVLPRLPRVAIVGRPNVGKSSLFNRILKQRKAIVYSERGTTRDRISQEAVFKDRRFILTDTGGFMAKGEGQLFKGVKEQIRRAVEESDFLLFVCDGREGTSGQDEELAALLRKSGKKIFLAVNKMDNERLKEGLSDFYKLGLDNPYPVSALHNLGMEDLLDDLAREFPSEGPGENKTHPIRVAIVGRPNVGKSSFLNFLLKEERVIVDETPGTTRDTVDTSLKNGETEFDLIDTAGIRHKKKIKGAVDVYSIMRAKEAIKRSDVCLVLVDAYDGITVDDLKILDLVLEEGKCCILCVNKWDLINNLTSPEYEERIYRRADFLRKYPVLFTSAKTGYNIYRSLGLIKEVIVNRTLRIPTNMLNRLLTYAKTRGPFAPRKNRLKIHYATQAAANPPTFLIFADNPQYASSVHKNFIENIMRKNFNLFGTPIRLVFRSSRKTEGGKR